MMTHHAEIRHNTVKPIHILLVEDNPAHAKLILRALEGDQLGNPVHCVVDGEEALDYLYRSGKYTDPELSPRPGIILLDLKLPKIDGIEVLEKIKSDPALDKIPVVVLTSSEEERDIRLSLANRADSFHSKPVDFEKFYQMVQDLAFYWTVWNRPTH